ncbi:flocculation protein FLO11 isoform X2 [Stegastes partitus]|uniref:Flocculation protein FLO11 isoform X2 n=1 Tax=Stegastes partitus TaxID=144197 RepID=A0A9Y4NE31_9TELE|nr:PREDICTED: flocculation protein FLO11-like isoform X2 [Stegastes partitus]
MSCATSLGAHVFVTAYLLFVVGCVAQKVYFDCGAKVDVVDVQGLILSPGFPYNYSSGTHCVWQFVVPIDYQLILEIFDFDVFESHDAAQYSAFSDFEEEEADEGETFTPDSLAADETSPEDKAPVLQSASKTQQPSQERAVPPEDKTVNSASSSHLREDLNPDSDPSTNVEETTLASPHSTDTPAVSPETQQSVLDACPHDVLYISDLITFSSRFCGSNRPPSSQLVFGSSQEMVEVIMELITTTHWGRGFALLFHYHNLTEPGGSRRAMAPTASKVDSLLAAVSGAAFFALILTSALCIIFRPKLCPKRASSCASSNSEVPEGVQNTRAEVSELQLMAENQANLETTTEQDNNNDSPPHTVSAGGDVSQNAEVDLSCSGLTELDLGADEVFIVSSAPSPTRLPFSPHTQRERFLRHSDTGPGPAGDWPSPDSTNSPAGARSVKDGSSGCARPRAWSVRTFQDFLPPLPQLHKKWCSWNSTSPFTKLVDSAPSSLATDCRAGDSRKVFSDVHLEASPDTSVISDSSISNASYPLTQSAQRQRRLNSTSNLRRTRFTGPCFGLLSGTTDPVKASGVLHALGSPSEPSSGSPMSSQCQIESNQAGKRRDFPGEGDHISVPVFAISEEEDRQPLVSAEHLDQTAASAVMNGLVRGTYEGKKPAVGSTSLSPQRARPEWRPWGSQVSGGVGPLPSSALTESNTVSDSQPPLSLSTGLCSVTNQM